MAALAYLLPPVTGLAAYLGGRDERVRFHGLQSIVLGTLWPTAMIAASWVTPGATQVAGALGALAWAMFLGGAALGRDPRWPLAGRALRALAADPPR